MSGITNQSPGKYIMRRKLFALQNLPKTIESLKKGDMFNIVDTSDKVIQLKSYRFQFDPTKTRMRYWIQMLYSGSCNITIGQTDFELSGNFLLIETFSHLTQETIREELDMLDIVLMEGGAK